jgi:hypothetical protein
MHRQWWEITKPCKICSNFHIALNSLHHHSFVYIDSSWIFYLFKVFRFRLRWQRSMKLFFINLIYENGEELLLPTGWIARRTAFQTV